MKNRKKGIIVLIVIIAVSIFFAAAGIIGIPASIQNAGSGAPRTPSFRSAKDGYIAVLYIEGIIDTENQTYNQKWLLETIDSLKNDKNNKCIILYINSPGGTVYEADEAYLALQNYKTTGKPIYAYQANLAASGGYYISCAADKIYANRNTLTGSIGVITGSSFDMTELLAKIGIKSETIHAGKNKNMFNYNEPVTDEQKQIMQTIADECYEQFIGIVATSRNIPLFEVRKRADGRIYTANQALKNGLIDAIDSWENMTANLQDEFFDGKEIPLIDFRYQKDLSIREMLFSSIFGDAAVKSIDRIMEQAQLHYPAFLYPVQ